MVMGTVLLGLLIAGAAVFLTNRPMKTRQSEAEKAAEPVEPVRPETKATAFDAEGADAEGRLAPATKLRLNGGSRAAGPRLTAEQCRELARIHRQNMLNRQHDSRMSAAAAVAGVVAGAALDAPSRCGGPAGAPRPDGCGAARQQQSDVDSYDTEDAADYGDYGDYGDDYTAMMQMKEPMVQMTTMLMTRTTMASMMMVLTGMPTGRSTMRKTTGMTRRTMMITAITAMVTTAATATTRVLTTMMTTEIMAAMAVTITAAMMVVAATTTAAMIVDFDYGA
mgnify:CR=1 FL=1